MLSLLLLLLLPFTIFAAPFPPASFDRLGTVNMTHCRPLDGDGICDLECDMPDVLEVDDCSDNPKLTDKYRMVIRPAGRIFTFERMWGSVAAELRCIYHARIRILSWKEIYPEGADPTDMSLVAGFSVEAELELEIESGIDFDKTDFMVTADNLMMGVPTSKVVTTSAWDTVLIVFGSVVVVGFLLFGVVTSSIWTRTRKRHLVDAPVHQIPKKRMFGLIKDAKVESGDTSSSTLGSAAPMIRRPLADRTNQPNQLSFRLEQTINGTQPPVKLRQPVDSQEKRNSDYATLSEVAVSQSDLLGAEPDIKVAFATTALHELIGSLENVNEDQVIPKVDELLNHDITLLEKFNEKQETALLMAVRKCFYKTSARLLQWGADPNAMDKWNRSCLHHAVHNTCIHTVRLLVADPRVYNKIIDDRLAIDAVDSSDRTPLMLCADYGWDIVGDIAKELVVAGANPNDAGDKRATNMSALGRTALHWAVIYGNIGMAEYLLSLEQLLPDQTKRALVNIDQQDMNGQTPLFQAVASGRLAMVQLLLENSANPGIMDQTKKSVLELAQELGHGSIEKLLKLGLSKTLARTKRRSTGRTPEKRKRNSQGSSTITPPDSAKAEGNNEDLNRYWIANPYDSQPVNGTTPPTMVFPTPPTNNHETAVYGTSGFNSNYDHTLKTTLIKDERSPYIRTNDYK